MSGRRRVESHSVAKSVWAPMMKRPSSRRRPMVSRSHVSKLARVTSISSWPRVEDQTLAGVWCGAGAAIAVVVIARGPGCGIGGGWRGVAAASCNRQRGSLPAVGSDDEDERTRVRQLCVSVLSARIPKPACATSPLCCSLCPLEGTPAVERAGEVVGIPSGQGGEYIRGDGNQAFYDDSRAKFAPLFKALQKAVIMLRLRVLRGWEVGRAT